MTSPCFSRGRPDSTRCHSWAPPVDSLPPVLISSRLRRPGRTWTHLALCSWYGKTAASAAEIFFDTFNWRKKSIIPNKYYTFHLVLYSHYKPTVLVLLKQLHTYISLLLHKHYIQILRKNTDLKDEYVANINTAINHQAKVTFVVKLAVRCFCTFLFRAVCKKQAKTNRQCT